MSTFGERIAALRKEEHLSQKDLAEQLNISKSTLSMYEGNQREPNFETMILIAEKFNVSLDYLLGRTNNRPVNHAADEVRTTRLEQTLRELSTRLKEGTYTVADRPMSQREVQILQAPVDSLIRIMQVMREGEPEQTH